MINNNLLTEVAKAFSGEGYVTPSFMAFGSTVIVPNAGTSSLTGEFGSRSALSVSRNNNVVLLSGIRSGAVVASSTGDVLNSLSMNSASSGGVHLSENTLSSIIHTTSFDVAVEFELRFNRG